MYTRSPKSKVLSEKSMARKKGERPWLVAEEIHVFPKARFIPTRRRILKAKFYTAFLAVSILLTVLLLPVITPSRRLFGKSNVPRLFKPTSYGVVHGVFAQSLNSTDDAAFDFVDTTSRQPLILRQKAISDFSIMRET